MRINPFKQPTSNSCVATCVAMLGGMDPAEANTLFTERYLAGEYSVAYMLAQCGVHCEVLTCDRVSSLNVGEVYLAIVPSVNTAGLNHMVIVDCRTNEGFMLVWDPARGTGVRHYVPVGSEELDLDPLATPLVAFTLTHRIICG